MQIVTFPIVCGPSWHIPAKFRRGRMNDCEDIANFQFPIWRPSAILNFGNMQILTFRTIYIPNLHLSSQNFVAIG